MSQAPLSSNAATSADELRPDIENDAQPDAWAGQMLDGAKAIQGYLVHLGFSDMTEKRVFYLAANKRLPIKKIGSRLVTSKRALLRHFDL